jgi:hypothetical protein
MITATEDDLTTLQERRRQLSDRLEELRSEQPDILADVAACEQDWLDAITVGDDSTLLSERLELRRRELASNLRAAEHVSSLLASVDLEIGDLTAKAQLAEDVQRYHEARIDYQATLPDLPDSLPDTVAVISDALDALVGEVDGARASHDRLAGMSAQLSQRAGMLGVVVDVPVPPSWSAGLDRAHGKETLFYQLMLATIQRRGAHSVLAEIERVIKIGLEDRRKAAR